MSAPRRWLRHLFCPPWRLRRAFPSAIFLAIERAIETSERHHLGEIRFAVEGALDVMPLWRTTSARERAIDFFSRLRVWDTERNNGVLIYVLLADRDVEIVADRGIHRLVPQHEWDAICRTMENAFRIGDFKGGSLAGIQAITALLTRHFPTDGENVNELPDQPFVSS